MARCMLALYAVILLLMSVHVHHEASVEAEDSCFECANHLPHSGHLTSAVQLMHDCVLCQMHSANYTAPAVEMALLPVVEKGMKVLGDVAFCAQDYRGINLSRGPPAACL